MTDRERREREDFEAWAIREAYDVSKEPDGDYSLASARDAWDAWQARAARAPEAAQGEAPGEDEAVKDAARQALYVAGLAPAASEPTAQAERCPHGVRLPHECKDCEVAECKLPNGHRGIHWAPDADPTAQRVTEPDDLTPLHTRGAAAWADVPDASAWVEGVRGNAGTEGSEPPTKKPYRAMLDDGRYQDFDTLAEADDWITSARAPEPVSDERICEIAYNEGFWRIGDGEFVPPQSTVIAFARALLKGKP